VTVVPVVVVLVVVLVSVVDVVLDLVVVVLDNDVVVVDTVVVVCVVVVSVVVVVTLHPNCSISCTTSVGTSRTKSRMLRSSKRTPRFPFSTSKVSIPIPSIP
jgi:hypothetical protein